MSASMEGGVAEATTVVRLGRSATQWTAHRHLSPANTAPRIDNEALERAIEQARDHLLGLRHSDGYWLGELEGDTILESEYVLLKAFLGQEHDEDAALMCRYIYEHQRADGGWSIYPGGPFEISASVKAYFALKLAGLAVDDPAMVRARELILEAGGVRACNSFTRFYLALLGQLGYDECPTVPPELIFLPRWLGICLIEMSAWTRTIVMPLAIMSAIKPSRALPPSQGIDELFRHDLPIPSRRHDRLLSWTNFFLSFDKVLKGLERVVPSSWRRPGIRAAHRWILDHFENSDGLGAIFPPMIYTVVMMKALGYEESSPSYRWAIGKLEELMIKENGSIRVQPCLSPVWDTAISAIALADAGVRPEEPVARQAVRWLLDKEIRTPGDWHARRSHIEPSGWHFQFQNEKYPDIDDTAMVLLALKRLSASDDPEVGAAINRGLDWLLGMVNKDGGWAAFDPDIDNEVLTKVPFADHNAMLDPSCADITARVLELLGTLGHGPDHPAARRGLEFLWQHQEPEGCWYGRWGVNYIYGTWQVLQGLDTLGFDMADPRVQKAADWLVQVQQPCGGWGETCGSYDDPTLKGQGEPTPSQTAWAVLGLIAAGRGRSTAAQRGLDYLIQLQNSDGSWDESQFTGTGFPKVFYLRYHLYRMYFPLMALARARSNPA